VLCQGLAEQLPHNNLQEERSLAREEGHCLEALGQKERESSQLNHSVSWITVFLFVCFVFKCKDKKSA